MVLFKMLNRGVFHDINGCISTGKEVMHSAYQNYHLQSFIFKFYYVILVSSLDILEDMLPKRKTW